ncbi:MAG: bile acid:sodium symporter family protein [Bacteroidales bacterium]|nr:bile acid:sodium symporter family protein [Bacteroidales bacterium]MCF8390335.1 bile acid:sodium symporter family protein [Bacteroidales bacterium]
MREALELLDAVHLNFSKEGLFVLNITLAFIMFGVALEIKPVHFKNVAMNPKSTIIGFFSQFFAMPFVTFILIILFGNFITPTIAMGMILVASCPGGNISNFMSSLAKANVALSVSLTAIATLSAVILTPLNFAIWGKLYLLVYNASEKHLLQPITIDPFEMFKTVFILLGVPLVLGMLFNNYFPKLTDKIVKPLKKLSILIFMALVVVMFMKNYEFFLKYIKFIFIIVLVHNIAALTTGYSIGSIFKRTVQDRRTLTIETGIQNSGLALVLLFNPDIFPQSVIVFNVEQPLEIGGMAFIAAWWGIWHIISGLTIASLWAKVPIDEKASIFYLLKKKKNRV